MYTPRGISGRLISFLKALERFSLNSAHSVRATLQRIHSAQLRRIGHIAPRGQLGLVGLLNAQNNNFPIATKIIAASALLHEG